jgi:hypothetical protein
MIIEKPPYLSRAKVADTFSFQGWPNEWPRLTPSALLYILLKGLFFRSPKVRFDRLPKREPFRRVMKLG